jgi:hypothetical protein
MFSSTKILLKRKDYSAATLLQANNAQPFVQPLDLLLDRASSFKLVDTEIVYIHGQSRY